MSSLHLCKAGVFFIAICASESIKMHHIIELLGGSTHLAMEIGLLCKHLVIIFVKLAVVRVCQLLQLRLSQTVRFRTQLVLENFKSLCVPRIAMCRCSMSLLLPARIVVFTLLSCLRGLKVHLLRRTLRLGVRHHDAHPWVSPLHLSVLLEQAGVLDLRVAVSKLMLFFLTSALATFTVLILAIFFLLDD